MLIAATGLAGGDEPAGGYFPASAIAHNGFVVDQRAAAEKTDPPPLRQDTHGVLRIAGTRMTLDSLVDLYDQGASAEEIALSFEALERREIYAARQASRRASTGLTT